MRIVNIEACNDGRGMVVLEILKSTRDFQMIGFIIRAEIWNDLHRYLSKRGIETKAHYTIPLHLHQAFHSLCYNPDSLPISWRQAGWMFGLPICPQLSDEERQGVVDGIRCIAKRILRSRRFCQCIENLQVVQFNIPIDCQISRTDQPHWTS